MPDPGRMPPHNIEAERGVLGSLLLDNQALHHVTPILKAEDFFRESHATIYRAICEFYDRAEPVDVMMLAEAMGRAGTLAGVGGDDALVEIMNAPPHSANAKYYAEIVRQKAGVRALMAAAQKILDDGYSNLYTSDELIESADVAVASIAGARLRDDLKTGADAATASLIGLSDRIAGVKAGIPTGIEALDDYLGGLRPGRLVVFAARPSIGKSSLVTTILYNVTAAGYPALLFSMEMDHAEIGDRLICGHSGVDGHKYTNPFRMEPGDHEAVVEAGDFITRLPLHIDDDSSKTIRQIAARSRRAVARDGVKLIAIDYLQLLDTDDTKSRASRSEFVAECSRRLKKLADELRVPIILVSQLNREAEKRDKKRPQLADLRESGAIEQDANVVGLLHRPDFYDPDDQPGLTELIIAKNRGGRTGTIKLGFQKGQTRFVDFEEPVPYFGHAHAATEPFG